MPCSAEAREAIDFEKLPESWTLHGASGPSAMAADARLRLRRLAIICKHEYRGSSTSGARGSAFSSLSLSGDTLTPPRMCDQT